MDKFRNSLLTKIEDLYFNKNNINKKKTRHLMNVIV